MAKTFQENFAEIVEHEGMKGRVTLKVTEFENGDPAYKVVFEGEELETGNTLAQLRGLLGGDEGYLLNPFTDEEYFFSLRPWQGCDSEQTCLLIQWQINYIKDVYPGDPRSSEQLVGSK